MISISLWIKWDILNLKSKPFIIYDSNGQESIYICNDGEYTNFNVYFCINEVGACNTFRTNNGTYISNFIIIIKIIIHFRI